MDHPLPHVGHPASAPLPRTALALLAASLCTTAGLLAQRQFDHCPKNHLPNVVGGVERFLWLDLDGDGDLDLQPIGSTSVQLMRSGSLQYTSQTSSLPGSIRHVDAVAADFDGDGDLDVAIARQTFSQLHLNRGGGQFVDSSNLAFGFNTSAALAVAAGDLDGDGDVDLVFGSDGFADSVMRNSGPASFTVVSNAVPTSSGSSAVALLDVDGDGDLDLVRGSASANTQLLLNNGTGAFAPAATPLPADGGSTSEIVTGDVDADGDLDLVIAKSTGGLRLLLAQGGGTFVDASSRLPGNLPSAERTLLVDLDNDGDLDVAMASTRGTVLLQNGGAQFTDVSSRLPKTSGASYGIGANDADGDGDQDLFVVSGRLLLYVNERNGREFVDASGTSIDVVQPAARLADIDNDGDLDLVNAPDSFTQVSMVHVNDGTGTFVEDTAARWNPTGVTRTFYGFEVGDVDGDGDVDLVLGQDGQDRMYFNDGRGVFTDVTATHLPVSGDRTLGIVLADLDGDGDLDLAGANSSEPNRIWRNDGTGHFANVPGAMPQTVLRTTGIVAIDADGDGDLDLVTTALNNPSGASGRLHLNDGTGIFTEAPGRIPSSQLFGDGLAVADFDADGDQDLVAFGSLLVNDGTGTFTDETAARAPRPSGLEPRFADFDADGDLDLIGYQSLLLNDGTGHFVDGSNRFAGSGYFGTVPRPYAIGDVDRDGDLDVIGSYDVFKNLERQVSTELLPRLGQSFTVDVRSRPGYGTNDSGAILFLATRTLSRPIRLGSFGLLQANPLTIFAADALTIPMATGEASRSWAIPNASALAGFDFCAQALVMHDGSVASWRFSNVVRETIVR